MDNLTEIFKIIGENLQAYIPELKPRKTSTGYKLTCPACNKPEAYYYKNNPKIIKCNRENRCGAQTSLYDYLKAREGWNDDSEVLKGLSKMTAYKLKHIQISAEEKQERAEQNKNEILFKVFKRWFENESYNKDLMSYLKNRGFSQGDINLSEIGLFSLKALEADFNNLSEIEIELLKDFAKYKNNYQLVIPWKNAKGKIITFQLRAISPDIQNKYLFHGPTENLLYNAQNAIKGQKDTCYIVEGVIDAIRLNSRGLTNILATGGPLAFNENKIQFLKDHFKYLILIPDNDEAGIKALDKTISILLSANINTYIKILPESINNKAIKDADDYLNAGMDIKDLNKIKAISGIKFIMANMDLNTEDPIIKDKNLKSLQPIIYNENLDTGARAEAINYLKKNGYTDQEIDLKRAEGREVKNQIITVEKSLTDVIDDFYNEALKRQYGEILGYRLNKFKKLEAKTDGIQTGLYLTAAGANVGKTALSTNLAIDLIQSNKNLKVLFYSFDDSKNIILNRFLAILSKTKINDVSRLCGARPEIIEGVQAAKDKMINWSNEDRFDLKDITQIRTIKELEADIEKSMNNNPKIVLFIDALFNLDTGGNGNSIRELNIDRAQKLKELSTRYNIPLFATAEIRKQNVKADKKQNNNDDRIIEQNLTLDAISESAKYSYEATFIIALSEKAENDGKLTIKAQILKNKLNSDKKTFEIDFYSSTGIMQEVHTQQERQNETRDLKDKCKNIVKTSIFNIK